MRLASPEFFPRPPRNTPLSPQPRHFIRSRRGRYRQKTVRILVTKAEAAGQLTARNAVPLARCHGAHLLDGLLARSDPVFGLGALPRCLDGDYWRPLHVRDEGRGGHPGGLSVGRGAAAAGRRASGDRRPEPVRQPVHRLCRVHPRHERVAKPGRRDDRGPLARPSERRGAVRARDRPLCAELDLFLVDGLVQPGAPDLLHRGPGVLDASERRLRTALLRPLHRNGRRLHGRLSLDGDRLRAGA